MKKVVLIFILILFTFITACGTAPLSDGNNADLTAVPTQVVVRLLNLDLALTAIPTSLPTATWTPAPTPTLFPTFTPVPTIAQELMVASATPTCTNLAEFIKNVNINDNVSLKSEQIFVKIWQVRNIGTCIWTTSYNLIFVTGEIMGGKPEIALSTDVAPGQSVDLRLDQVAPANPGPYIGSWMLRDPDGNIFGVGSGGSQPLNVIISVKPIPPKTPS